MITESNRLYITGRLTDWAGNNSCRVAWLAECAARHLHGDDDDLDDPDTATTILWPTDY